MQEVGGKVHRLMRELSRTDIATVTKSQSPPIHRKEESRNDVKLFSDEDNYSRHQHKIACYDLSNV